jgi:hypothetical protein
VLQQIESKNYTLPDAVESALRGFQQEEWLDLQLLHQNDLMNQAIRDLIVRGSINAHMKSHRSTWGEIAKKSRTWIWTASTYAAECARRCLSSNVLNTTCWFVTYVNLLFNVY